MNINSRKIAGVIVALVIGYFFYDCMLGDMQLTPGRNEGVAQITKAEWRKRALPYYNPYGGGVRIASVAQFKQAVGEPDSTQLLGGDVYWYYHLADGTVQVKLADPAISDGQLVILAVNED